MQRRLADPEGRLRALPEPRRDDRGGRRAAPRLGPRRRPARRGGRAEDPALHGSSTSPSAGSRGCARPTRKRSSCTGLSARALGRRDCSATEAYERPGSPEWISGACMLVRRRALEELGGLDEGFFLYCEDTDLCKRLWDAGHGVRFEPARPRVHEGGASAPRPSLIPVLVCEPRPLREQAPEPADGAARAGRDRARGGGCARPFRRFYAQAERARMPPPGWLRSAPCAPGCERALLSSSLGWRLRSRLSANGSRVRWAVDTVLSSVGSIKRESRRIPDGRAHVRRWAGSHGDAAAARSAPASAKRGPRSSCSPTERFDTQRLSAGSWTRATSSRYTPIATSGCRRYSSSSC